MLLFAKRLESLCNGIESAKSKNDTVSRYRLVFAMLSVLLTEHKRLKSLVVDIERRSTALNTLPTKYCEVSASVYHSGRGWGRNRSSGHYTGKDQSGQLSKMPLLKAKEYADQLATIVTDQLQVNEELELLQQYAIEFSKHRKALLALKPKNVGQRRLQNVLLVTCVKTQWNRSNVERNPVLGVICGEFDKQANTQTIMHFLLKRLDDVKGSIGRKSESEGYDIVRKYSHSVNSKPDMQYLEWYSRKEQRCSRIEGYVKQSKRYQDRLSWIVGLNSNEWFVAETALKVLPYVDNWKEQYGGMNRLAYMTATNKRPYVKTIVCSQIEIVGTIRHLETDVNVYFAECIEYEASRTKSCREQKTVCFFLGKTGSRTVDDAIRSVDWYHQPIQTTENEIALQKRIAIDTMRQRLGYARNQKLSLMERRKEIAAYARKLVWLETMSMLDSKKAGNCLPGTIQFAKELGLPSPLQWQDYSIDTRTLLRAWKSKGYGVNRLLLPAIDAAVDRVKNRLVQLTVSCYTPSVVR